MFNLKHCIEFSTENAWNGEISCIYCDEYKDDFSFGILRRVWHCPDDGGRKYLYNIGELLPDNTVQYPRRQSPYAWNYFLLTVRGIAYILTEKYKNIFSYLKYSSVVNGYVLVSKLPHSLSIVMEIRAWWVGRNATVFWLSEGIVPASWQNATKFLREKLSRISGTIEQTFHKTVSDLCDKLFSPYKFERR